ncbi:MAG TPA: YraN family protein [Cyanobacteria bacterium UBA8156]|jgi:putative endonuclease|nr:YraN family protein [Cyanobacteria bacterium UBA8156]
MAGLTGAAGEAWVAQYLEAQGWHILARRWRTREAEVDLIAQQNQILIFVEVKTRRAGNWDAGGRSSVSLRKQHQIALGAAQFLAQHPTYIHHNCRFDVAIVAAQGSTFRLTEYLANAFDSGWG